MLPRGQEIDAEGDGMSRLQGRVAIVTGAGGGIGGAVCRHFAREGAAIVCVDIDSGTLERTAESVRALGVRVVAMAADVADEATARASVADAVTLTRHAAALG